MRDFIRSQKPGAASIRPNRKPSEQSPWPVWSVAEQLEERRLLSVFTVMNTNDSGPDSLRQAILDANSAPGADEIWFDPSLKGTITLVSGELFLRGDLDIQGPGANVLAISGNRQDRVFEIRGGTVRISDLSITQGATGHGEHTGGGIFNDGDLTLNNSKITGNSADWSGGGIFNNSGTVTLINTTVMGNSASDGGGVFNSGTLELTDSTITGNGEGIYNDGTLWLSNSTISSNGSGLRNEGTATITSGTIFGNTGGSGGIVNGDHGMLTISDSTIARNSAYFGAGITNSGMLEITNSTISDNNQALGGGADGGISNGGTLFIASTTISGNGGSGIHNGGVLTIVNSTISANRGIGLDNANGTVVLRNATISTNLGGCICGADGDTAYNTIIAGNSQYDVVNGGSLGPPSSHNLIGGDPKLAILGDYGGATMTMPPLPGSPALDAGDNSLAAGASGTDQRGKPRFTDGNGDGMAIVDIGSVEGSETMSLPTSLSVSILADEEDGNFAADDLSLREAVAIANYRPGPDVIRFDDDLKGAIVLTQGELFIGDDLSILGPNSDVLALSGNHKSRVLSIPRDIDVQIAGLSITAGLVSSRDGGAIHNRGNLTVIASTISANRATGGCSTEGRCIGRGGGIFNEGSLRIDGSTVAGNEGLNGGGVFNSNPSGILVVVNSSISGNSAYSFFGGQGGGVSNGGTFNLVNSTISGNSAGDSAGGIANYGRGGGIYNSFVNPGTVTITNSTISGNVAVEGGGIFNAFGLDLMISNSIVAGNSSIDLDGIPLDPPPSYSLIGGDPNLLPLGNYGGPTMTMPPRPGSPAIDAGDNSLAKDADGNALISDQRGQPRILDGNGDGTATVDIGAVEFQPALNIGDINQDGHIDADDYFLIDRGFADKLSGPENGDLDGNGIIDADDYSLIDIAFATQGQALATTALIRAVAPVNSTPTQARARIRHKHHQHLTRSVLGPRE